MLRGAIRCLLPSEENSGRKFEWGKQMTATTSNRHASHTDGTVFEAGRSHGVITLTVLDDPSWMDHSRDDEVPAPGRLEMIGELGRAQLVRWIWLRAASQDMPALFLQLHDRNSPTFSCSWACPFVFAKLRGGECGATGAASPIAERVGQRARSIMNCLGSCVHLSCRSLVRPHSQNQLTTAVRTFPFLHNLAKTLQKMAAQSRAPHNLLSRF